MRATTPRKAVRIFFGLVLPLLAVLNLGLSLLVLAGLRPSHWIGWVEIGTGCFCALVAGWLAATGWSRWYWRSAMSRQVTTWHRIVDVMFGWLEEAPVPADSLRHLKSSLDRALTD